MTKRIIFAGTPEFAAGNLQALVDAGMTPIAAYSQPDRPKGRGKKLIPTPVKQVALEHHIEVFQPLNFKDPADLKTLAALKPDLMIVVAYGLLLPQALLDIPKYGCINVHASLLPKWRGAAPIERSLEEGDTETGVTIMQMDAGLDTGDIIEKRPLAIDASITGDNLREQLLTIGSEALIKTVHDIFTGMISKEKQNNNLANYAHKLTKQEAEIDWGLPAISLKQKIHAFNSANICYSVYQGERIKISLVECIDDPSNSKPGEILSISKKTIDVATGNGMLRLKEIQLPNAKRLPVAAVLNGKAGYFMEGQHFG